METASKKQGDNTHDFAVSELRDVDDLISRKDILFPYWIVTCGGVALGMYLLLHRGLVQYSPG